MRPSSVAKRRAQVMASSLDIYAHPIKRDAKGRRGISPLMYVKHLTNVRVGESRSHKRSNAVPAWTASYKATYPDDLVDELGVEHSGDEASADALDLVGTRLASREDGGLGGFDRNQLQHEQQQHD